MADEKTAPVVQPPAQPDVLGVDHIGHPDYDPNCANPAPMYVFGPPDEKTDEKTEDNA